jgi:cysteine desulfurase / selenocysteine lyase
MSTSNPLSDSTLGSLVPDAAVIAKLANEFFGVIPGQPGAPSGASALSGQPPVPSVASTPSPAVAAPSPVPGAPSGSLATVAPLPASTQVLVSPVGGPLGLESPASLPMGLGAKVFDFRSSPESEPESGYAFAIPNLPVGTDSRAYSFLPLSPVFQESKGEPLTENGEKAASNSSVPTSSQAPPSPEEVLIGIPAGAGTGGFPGFSPTWGTKNQSEEKGALPDSFDAYAFPPFAVGEDTSRHPSFDPNWFKRDFPILQQRVNGRPLVWLDNAATTQKPQSVIDRLDYFYANENSNVHRAAHTLAARATDAYEGAREKVRRFLGASSAREIVFVRGATEAINLVAKAWGGQNIKEGDEIVVTWLEHHANIVPWQQLVAEKGAKLKVVPVDDRGQVRLDEYEKLLGPRTRIVSITQVSNALGTVVPVKEMTVIAHRYGAKVLVDGAQAVSHVRVNVAELDSDFYVFSGHKVFGPTGIGALYGKEALLNSFQPWQGGGNMIADVTFDKTLYQPAPARFEAGTGNIADAVGLGAALDYLDRVGLENVARHEHDLLVYGTKLLKEVPGLHIIGNAAEKAGVLSFVIDGIPNAEVGKALDREGIAVRSGHHCAQPILRRMGVEGTVRASLAFYNNFEDLEALGATLCRLVASKVPMSDKEIGIV